MKEALTKIWYLESSTEIRELLSNKGSHVAAALTRTLSVTLAHRQQFQLSSKVKVEM